MDKKLKFIFLDHSKINKILTQKPIQGKRLLEPLKSLAIKQSFPLRILEDHRLMQNDAEVHKREGDLWCCISGEVVFTCGGDLVDPSPVRNLDGTENLDELKAKTIRRGTKIIMRPGDWLWIPPGQSHQHVCKRTGRLFIIKIKD